MSLKAFHLFFIALSVLLCIGFAVWALDRFDATQAVEYVIVATVSFLTAAALGWYGIMFVRKMKHLPMLVIAALALVLPTPAFACPICYGDPDSLMAQGISKGVLALLGVTVVVLAWFATFFIYLMRRIRAAEAATEAVPADETGAARSPAA